MRLSAKLSESLCFLTTPSGPWPATGYGLARRLGPAPFSRFKCVGNATNPTRNQPMVRLPRDLKRGAKMRALIVCAIVITASIGLAGCFHHSQAVTQEPLKLG